MDETLTLEQARTIAVLLPSLMRSLAAPDDDLSTNLPLAQLRLCSILYGGPRGMSALSRELGVSLSALTQMADRLEKSRLVSRVTFGSDRRVRHLELAQRGRDLMRFRENARIERVLAVLEYLSPEKREEVTAAMETLMKACAAVRGREVADPAAEAASSSVFLKAQS